MLTKSEEEIFIKLLNANKYHHVAGENVELEIRLRTMNDKTGRSTPFVTEQFFNDMLAKKELFSSEGIFETSIILKQYEHSSMRLECYPNKSGKMKKVFVNKKQIKSVVIDRLLSKVALAEEKEVEEPDVKYNYVKLRKRQSFISFNKLWRFDFTHIFIKGDNMNNESVGKWYKSVKSLATPDNYELEIEYIGKDTDNIHMILKSIKELYEQMNIVSNLETICFKNEAYYDIKSMIPHKLYSLGVNDISFSKITEKVKTLQDFNLRYIKDHPFMITEKVDGERHLLYIHKLYDEIIYKLIDSRDNCKIIKRTTLNDPIASYVPILIDGEVIQLFDTDELISLDDIIDSIRDMISGKREKTILDTEFKIEKSIFVGFDLLILNGNSVTKSNFDKRYELLQKLDLDSIDYRIKEYLEFSEKNIQLLTSKKNNYLTDGIIIVPKEQGYYNNNTFKWKYPELNSIDYLVRIVDDDDNNEITLHLYVGARKQLVNKFNISCPDYYTKYFSKYKNQSYIPVIFSPKNQPKLYISKQKYVKRIKDSVINDNILSQYVYTLDKGRVPIRDNTILEMIYDKSWVVLRTREDKTEKYERGENMFGNDWYTALNNWKTIKEAITFDGGESYYKQEYKDKQVKTKVDQLKLFHNYVKRDMYMEYAYNSNYLLELGGGRANDLYKWGSAKIKDVVLIDFDKSALEQAKKRRLQYKPKFPKLSLIQGNLQTTQIRKLLKTQFFNTKLHGMFDIVVCNFAFHYFIKNTQTLNRILNEIYLLLKVDGIFMMSAHDSEKLLELFTKYDVKQHDKLYIYRNKISKEETDDDMLFKFTKLFKGDKINKAGQKISVWVESIGVEHEEYLVNFAEIEKIMTTNNKFSVIDSFHFDEKYDDFTKKKNVTLDLGEKTFSFTNKYMIFKKNMVKNTKIKKSRKKMEL